MRKIIYEITLLIFIFGLRINSFSSNKAMLEPLNLVYYEGDVAVITCSADNIIDVVWHYNESLQPYIYADFSDPVGLGFFRIQRISKSFNETTLQCEAILSNGRVWSRISQILVQGITNPVSHLNYEFVHSERVRIFWKAPFSLDVPGYDTDVTYCVDILNSSSMTVMYSECGINKTYHTCESFPDLVACAEYFISVKAQNPVGNSTAMNLIASNRGFLVANFAKINCSEVSTRYEIAMNKSFCPLFTELRANGADIEYHIISSKLIEFDLDNNRHYNNISLHLSTPSYSEFENLGSLKTYDIVDFEASPYGNNSIILLTSFVLNSAATGVLYILMSLENGKVNFSNSVYIVVNRVAAEGGINVEGISSGLFLILAYDIEFKGRLQPYGYPSSSQWIYVNGSQDVDKSAIKVAKPCSMTISRLKIYIVCFCKFVSYQVLLQRNYGNINNVQNITTQQENCSKSTIFDVVNFGVYFITAFQDSYIGDTLNSTLIFAREFSVEKPSDKNPDIITVDNNLVILESSGKYVSSTHSAGFITAFVLSSMVAIIAIISVMMGIVFLRWKSKEKKNISDKFSERNNLNSKNSSDNATRENMDSSELQGRQCSIEENCFPIQETIVAEKNSEICNAQLNKFGDSSNLAFRSAMVFPNDNKKYYSNYDLTESLSTNLQEQGSIKLVQSAPVVVPSNMVKRKARVLATTRGIPSMERGTRPPASPFGWSLENVYSKQDL